MLKRADIETLMDRVALGDRRAFARLYDVTSARLYALILAITDQTKAPAVLTQCYITIWRKADRFRSSDLEAMTWLIMITRDAAIAHRRSEDADISFDKRQFGDGPLAQTVSQMDDDFRASFFAAFRGWPLAKEQTTKLRKGLPVVHDALVK